MSRLPVESHPHADFEIEEARDWYLYVKKSPQAASRFLDEFDHAVRRIQEEPQRWPEYLGGTRRFMLRRFPYIVVYAVLDESILIVAVAHVRRRQGYWMWRVKVFSPE